MHTLVLNTVPLVVAVKVLDARTNKFDTVNIQPKGRIHLASYHTVDADWAAQHSEVKVHLNQP